MSVASRSRSGRYSLGGSSFSSFIRRGNEPVRRIYTPSYYSGRSTVSSLSSRSRKSYTSSSRRGAYRKKARRSRRATRRRRYKWRPAAYHAAQLWLQLSPEARKIKARSARFCEYYALPENGPDLDAFICRTGLVPALDGIACILTQAPYGRYLDLDDDLKHKARGVWYSARLKGLAHTHEMLVPGRIIMEKLERATARKATIEQIKKEIYDRCDSSTISTMGVPVSLQSALAHATAKTTAGRSSRTVGGSGVDQTPSRKRPKMTPARFNDPDVDSHEMVPSGDDTVAQGTVASSLTFT